MFRTKCFFNGCQRSLIETKSIIGEVEDYDWDPVRPSDLQGGYVPPFVAQERILSLLEAFVRDGRLAREVASRRLARLSNWNAVDQRQSGHDYPPLVFGDGMSTLAGADTIRLREGTRLLWRDDGTNLTVACNGQADGVPSHPGIVRLFEALGTGESWTLADLLDRARGLSDPEGRGDSPLGEDAFRAALAVLDRMQGLDG